MVDDSDQWWYRMMAVNLRISCGLSGKEIYSTIPRASSVVKIWVTFRGGKWFPFYQGERGFAPLSTPPSKGEGDGDIGDGASLHIMEVKGLSPFSFCRYLRGAVPLHSIAERVKT